MNSRLPFIAVLAGALMLPAMTVSCGYRLGGTRPVQLENVKSARVILFKNNSLEPQAAILLTSALAEEIQRDGTFALKGKGLADARVEGAIKSVSYDQLRYSEKDTYRSTELGLTLHVTYQVIDNRTNKVLYEGEESDTAPFYDSTGNAQTARTNALSFAARRVATLITQNITNG